jgi:hypothetical protein
MDEREQKIIDKLILNGAMQMAGVDCETGEILYQFTPKLKEVMPELYHEHLNHVNSEIMRLWEKGFVNIDLMADSPIVTLSDKAFDDNEIQSLSHQDKWAVQEVKRLLATGEL